ncbi:MAG: hypothetical protein F6J86_18145 [Symploca sp. SIO1B1]|nr:hypothetical protein [Symploca sp. SIO2D2]NER23216.1 hypothetical protein [Symploca sp. SIO1C2]NER49881.1 hypothetical protein [Symploca sp. SIO1A3]NER95731.1 hypothetical protein [Symploca sp. SIO1B1]
MKLSSYFQSNSGVLINLAQANAINPWYDVYSHEFRRYYFLVKIYFNVPVKGSWETESKHFDYLDGYEAARARVQTGINNKKYIPKALQKFKPTLVQGTCVKKSNDYLLCNAASGLYFIPSGDVQHCQLKPGDKVTGWAFHDTKANDGLLGYLHPGYSSRITTKNNSKSELTANAKN